MNLNKDHWLYSRMNRLAYDFHIPDTRDDFLCNLDPVKTARIISGAGVQMMQLCAKSHWGLSLHPTKVGKQHPLLKGRDYFGEVLSELNKKDIRCMGYLSDYWDNHAAALHPEWCAVNPLRQQDEPWLTLCPNTGNGIIIGNFLNSK